MNKQYELLNDLCKLYKIDDKEGYMDTFIEDVKVFRISNNESMMPLLYNRGISFIGHGAKVGFIQGKQFTHSQEDYLLITSPQPIDCETFTYNNNPMIGIYINLDMTKLHKISTKLNELTHYKSIQKEIPFSVIASKRDRIIEDVYIKLLNVLHSPIDSEILGSSILDELYLRLLQSENGYVLRQLCEHGSSFSKISKVVEVLHKQLDEKISLEEMAKMADMSVNNFLKIFKDALNDTPIQYIKKIRLNKARQLILHKNLKAVDAAYQVGYESPTQFSREFKRYFGVTPSKISELGYTHF